jgi:hypothetical protein
MRCLSKNVRKLIAVEMLNAAGKRVQRIENTAACRDVGVVRSPEAGIEGWVRLAFNTDNFMHQGWARAERACAYPELARLYPDSAGRGGRREGAE